MDMGVLMITILAFLFGSMLGGSIGFIVSGLVFMSGRDADNEKS